MVATWWFLASRSIAGYSLDKQAIRPIHTRRRAAEPAAREAIQVCSLCPASTLRHTVRNIGTGDCRYFTCEKLLLDPNFVLAGRPVTTDEFVSVCGGTGLCFETGIASEISTVDGVVQIVMSIMAKEMKMLGTEDLEGHSPAEPKDNAKERYIMTEVFLLVPCSLPFCRLIIRNAPLRLYRQCKRLTDSGFRWGEEKGSRNFEFIKRGETIGYEDDGKMPVVAGYDAVLVFPKVPELWKVNS